MSGFHDLIDGVLKDFHTNPDWFGESIELRWTDDDGAQTSNIKAKVSRQIKPKEEDGGDFQTETLVVTIRKADLAAIPTKNFRLYRTGGTREFRFQEIAQEHAKHWKLTFSRRKLKAQSIP